MEILITSYVDPDLDSVACAVAHAEFLNHKGIKAIPGFSGDFNVETKYIADKINFKLPKQISDFNLYEKIIIVDVSDGTLIHKKIDCKNVIGVIDHRKIHQAQVDFPNAKIQIELVGAAATLIAEKFYNDKIKPSKISSILLFCAIASNTLNFQSSTTTGRDKKIADWLKNHADISDNLINEMFLAKSDLSGNKLRNAIEGDYAVFNLHKRILIAQLEIIGAKKLISQRKNEILNLLEKLCKIENCYSAFLTISDLFEKKNYYVTDNKEMQNLLMGVLGVKFVDDIAHRSGLLMRKELVWLIKGKQTKNRLA